MKYILVTLLFFLFHFEVMSQEDKENTLKNRFKFFEVKSHGGAFLKSDNALGNSGILDNGYGGVTIKLGWQPISPESWSSRFSYPSYGIGLYSGFLSDAEVFGNPNAVYGFINFPISLPEKKNVFSIEASLGLTYNLNPYDSETNPVNKAIGARAAVYFNVDFGFAYKFTRELDILYGFDFTHFSNGSTYQPNNGLNLYGLNLGLRYHYNAAQFEVDKDIYTNNLLPARFRRPLRAERNKKPESAISIFAAGGFSQRKKDAGTEILYGTFSSVLDYEYQFNEMHLVNAGVDLFFDNRLRSLDVSERFIAGIHAGYDFNFWRFAIKFQLGTYLTDDRGKGTFFIRPALRYHISKTVFAQVGLKTLAGGAADYIEYGIGIKAFKW